jgi:hypothetical protein
VIPANSELQHELQLRYDDIILLSHKRLLSRLSPRHTLNFLAVMLHVWEDFYGLTLTGLRVSTGLVRFWS